jgi:hypothetical protein
VSWAGTATEAKLGTLTILVSEVSRTISPRISTHGTPGTKGDETFHHGRKSHTDNVTALVTLAQSNQIDEMAESDKLITWQHPLKKGFKGRIKSLEDPVSSALQDYLSISFTIEESVEIDPIDWSWGFGGMSPSAGRTTANGHHDAFGGAINGLPDLPSGGDTTTFNTAVDSFDSGFADVDAALGEYIDGDGTWQDISRSLDVFSTACDAVEDAARTIEDSLGEGAITIIQTPGLIEEVLRDVVETTKQSAATVATFVTLQPTELFTIMSNAGADMSDDNIDAIMRDNELDDPFAIQANVTLNIPLVARGT